MCLNQISFKRSIAVKVIIVVLIEGSEGPLVPWCQSGQPCNMAVMQILLLSSVQNDGTSFWLLKKAQLVEWGNLILLHPRFKSYDLNQKGWRFVSRSQITLIKLRFSHVSSRKHCPVLQRGFTFPLPCSWFKGQLAYRCVLERGYQGRKQNIQEAYRESFYCALSLSRLSLAVFFHHCFSPWHISLCINGSCPLLLRFKFIYFWVIEISGKRILWSIDELSSVRTGKWVFSFK